MHSSPFVTLIGLGLVALLVLGGLLVTLLLLAHPKSRPLGLALLGVGVGGVVLLAGFWAWVGTERLMDHPERERAEALEFEARRSGHESGSIATRPESETRTMAEANAAAGVDRSPPAASSRQPGRVLKALGTALARGIQETKKDGKNPQEPAAGEATTDLPEEMPPDWIDMEPGRAGDTYRVSVVIGPFQTSAECVAELPDALDQTLRDYARQYLGPAAAAKVHFPPDVLEERLVQERWEETKVFETVGLMKQLHLLLQFDPEMRQDIAEQWDQARLNNRLWYTGTGLAVLLGLLAVAYGVLIADRAAGGQCRGRLGFAAVVAATLVVGIAAAVIAVLG
jgi:hypothetical protein